MQARQSLIDRLYPKGIPKLLCPPLTHFSGPMQIDRPRMAAHYRDMVARVRAFLIPGSTGDGWLMDDAMMLDVLALSCEHALGFGGGILAAVLKPELSQMLTGINQVCDAVFQKTGRRDIEGFLSMGLAGITVCAPKGEERTQAEIEAALRAILDLGLPTALYQLPQITQNEIGPEVFARLANDYPHFYLFKDTSGRDAIAKSGVDAKGVYLVRGAEGGYAGWYKGCGGPYDGFLLSTANGFSGALASILAMADAGDREGAMALSSRLDAVVSKLFDIAAQVSISNPFANSARIADHLCAYGPDYQSAPPPCLPDGSPMDAAILAKGTSLMQEGGFVPEKGYLPFI